MVVSVKNSKKWYLSLISLSLVTVIIFGISTYILDPLVQYKKESGIFTYYESSEIYSNPGIAKNYDYDSVLVGSSMVENTNVAEIDDLFGYKTIKVPYSGGSSFNHKNILEVCFKSNEDIKTVFWSLDEYALTTDYMTPRYPLPEYLYDFDKTNDLSYLLNLDVFYFYTIKDIIGTLRGKKQLAMRDGSWIEDESVYCKENMLSSFEYPMKQSKNQGEKCYEKNLYDNINYNILPMIRNHKDTNFKFYMVPYSIAYWYMEKSNGKLDGNFYNVKKAISEILEYDNVEVYFFQDDEEIITNLDNYKDYTHFKSEINSYMSKEMNKGTHKLTKDNYLYVLDSFYNYLNNFDYDTFFISQKLY